MQTNIFDSTDAIDQTEDYSLHENLLYKYLNEISIIREIFTRAEKQALAGTQPLKDIKAECFDELYCILSET